MRAWELALHQYGVCLPCSRLSGLVLGSASCGCSTAITSWMLATRVQTASSRRAVTARRENDQRVPVPHARGENADRRDGLGAVPAGVDEAVRHPAQQHVDPRIKGERVLEHEQRPPARVRQQSIKEQEGVSWPGVPGQDDDGPGRGTRTDLLPL